MHLSTELSDLVIELPVVTENTSLAVIVESEQNTNYITGTIERLRKDNPLAVDFIEKLSWSFDSEAAKYAGILVYRLLEKQGLTLNLSQEAIDDIKSDLCQSYINDYVPGIIKYINHTNRIVMSSITLSKSKFPSEDPFNAYCGGALMYAVLERQVRINQQVQINEGHKPLLN